MMASSLADERAEAELVGAQEAMHRAALTVAMWASRHDVSTPVLREVLDSLGLDGDVISGVERIPAPAPDRGSW
jgi:hypothetical protein